MAIHMYEFFLMVGGFSKCIKISMPRIDQVCLLCLYVVIFIFMLCMNQVTSYGETGYFFVTSISCTS